MKILFIEDDRYTRELLSSLLSAHRYIVDVVDDGVIGMDMAIQWSYDLILLDILVPSMNGIEVCRRLRSQNCTTPILMVTNKDSNDDVVAGLDAGADDYIAKSCAPAQLLARVRALLRRGGAIAPSPVLAWGDLCLDPALARVTYQQSAIPFRPKEYALLELFLRNPRRLLSRRLIIDHLWSVDETPVEGSVTNLIKDLRRRLKSAGIDADLIETVYGLGYRLKTPPQPVREYGDAKLGVAERSFQAQSTVPPKVNEYWEQPSYRGITRIQRLTERFQGSLAQRVAILQDTEQQVQQGNLNIEQQKAARTEAHKLAGGLGTFGYAKASEIARTIEQLLDAQESQGTRFARQFSALVQELQQEISQPLTQKRIAD